MRLDATHRGWFIATMSIVAISSALYAVYATTTSGGPSGGTWIGLAYGVAGAGMILFAGLLGIRKKVLLLRIGSVTWWMRGHLWLGALALPMVFFHAGFSFGGQLTTILMWLLLVVVVSGLVGSLLQHILPPVVTARVAEESAYDQLERARLQLRREAYELVLTACGRPLAASKERAELEEELKVKFRDPKHATTVEGETILAEVYVKTVLPYVRRPNNGVSPLSDGVRSALLFDQLRPQLHPSLHVALDDLASICSTLRQRERQIRLHRWLHGWLLIHIPCSIALLVLMVVHSVMALYY